MGNRPVHTTLNPSRPEIAANRGKTPYRDWAKAELFPLLILVAAILVVPFAMNFSAHIIANSTNRSVDATHSNAEHESH